MSKPKQPDSIPDNFQSYEEAGKFWDTHDTTEYSNIFRTIGRGEKRRAQFKYWKSPSVLKLAGSRDPIEVITEKAQDVVFRALEEGWAGPPFDPMALAKIQKIKLLPCNNTGDAIRDARLVADAEGKLTIEYNPNRPSARIRFSICHEIAHSFFPDCADRIRHRLAREEIHGTDRQEEMLCNLGAAELLMPIGSFAEMAQEEVTIDKILELRKKFEVSTEAVLLRTVKLSRQQIAAFSAVASERAGTIRYAIEYCTNSNAWPIWLKPGFELPENTELNKCVAIGYTTKGSEVWKSELGQISVQGVGVPSYPSPNEAKPSDYLSSKLRSTQSIPRVVGLIWPESEQNLAHPTVTYLQRDATDPIDSSRTIIAHIVNDKTPNWGAGFGRFIAKKWPTVQSKFKSLWTRRGSLPLGRGYLTDVSSAISVFHMVAQHGYAHSSKPLIRYEKLRECLQQLTEVALEKHARVQMPRIGAGEAGGSWPVIEEMIEDTLCRRGIAVAVCDLPGVERKVEAQLELIEQIKWTA